MTVIGYARVSTTDQNLEIQEAALKRLMQEMRDLSR
jgi:DNA invertase Pin-like site-specific DNA recombinase